MKVKPKIAESATAKKKRYEGFTGEEKSAMQERVREQKVRGKADGESELLAKIAEMPESDRVMAKRVHAVVKASGRTKSGRNSTSKCARPKGPNKCCRCPRNPSPW